jgi:polyisoprenoid-binding protein YceI
MISGLLARFARGISSLVLVPCAFGCGSKIQRPPTTPVSEQTHVAPAPPPPSFGPLAKRYIVHTKRSRLEVIASDTVLGTHHITFDRWRAYVDTDPSLTIHVVIEVSSMRMDPPSLGAWIQTNILEARRYPEMKLEASMKILDAAQGTSLVDAIAELHGVCRALRFEGTVTKEENFFRFRSEVTLKRQDFKLRAPKMVDGFVNDDITITVDAVATPETVRAEEVEQVTPTPPPPE